MTGPKLDDVPVLYQVRPRNFPEGEGWREVSRRNFDDYGDFPGYPDAEWERRKLYAEPQPALAIDLEQGMRDLYRAYVRLLESGRDRITSLGGDCDPVDMMERSDIDLRKARDLLARIDGQSLQASPVAQRKLRDLQDEGFIVNGVAIFNPTTGRRGLVDYLGYVGWQTSEQPTKGEGE